MPAELGEREREREEARKLPWPKELFFFQELSPNSGTWEPDITAGLVCQEKNVNRCSLRDFCSNSELQPRAEPAAVCGTGVWEFEEGTWAAHK